MLQTLPFLLFDGVCADAMAFYRACLGGELTVTRLSDTPLKTQMPPELHNRVVYAKLNSGAVEISATDWLHPTRKPLPGNTVAIYLTGNSFSELKPIFDRLSAGAEPSLLDDLREMPFGIYGHLADKYGIHWFFRSA